LQELPQLPDLEEIPVSQELVFYDVEGRTQRALNQNLRLNGPLGYDAETRYEISTYYEFTQSDSECRLTYLEVPLHITITYPNWVDVDRASRRRRVAWERRVEVLQVHENGHALLAWVGATELRNSVIQQGEAENCETLSSQINSAQEEAHEHMRAKQREYDRITSHGVEQSAYDWTPILGVQE